MTGTPHRKCGSEIADIFKDALSQQSKPTNAMQDTALPEIIHVSVNVHVKVKLKSNKIVCLGISYKPDIEDTRQSPAIQIALKLANIDISRQLLNNGVSDTTGEMDVSEDDFQPPKDWAPSDGTLSEDYGLDAEDEITSATVHAMHEAPTKN